MTDEYLSQMKEDFGKARASLEKDLTSVRTGRASPQLLDSVNVMVASYGTSMPIKQLASISAPDARMLVVNPWDKGTIKDIEKALLSSGLGLTPSGDGQIIRLPIPPLTGDRRQELVRLVRKMTEDARIRARQVRREYLDIFKEMESEKEISEDDLRRLGDQVQKATDAAIAELDQLSAAKEAEVLEV
ncbi:MAG: ribosome recycling factor [Myxococcota bacterium]